MHQNPVVPYVMLAFGVVATAACLWAIGIGVEGDRVKQIAFDAVMLLPCVGIAAFGVTRLRTPHSITLDVNAFHVTKGDDSEVYPGRTSRTSADETGWAGFDLVAKDQPGRHRKAVDVTLPDNYRLSYAELASLLTQWQAKALRNGA